MFVCTHYCLTSLVLWNYFRLLPQKVTLWIVVAEHCKLDAISIVNGQHPRNVIFI